MGTNNFNNPVSNIYTESDMIDYADLMIRTNALYEDYNRNIQLVQGPVEVKKWRTILSPIWGKLHPKYTKPVKGEGIILSSDPVALKDRLNLLIASKEAGNTGVRNDIVSICDELLRQNVTKKNEYKTLMLHP